MSNIFFLGSDRLPHCDDNRNGSSGCGEEVYFSGEVIKFVIDTTPFKNYSQPSIGCTGQYYLPGENGYAEGVNPPVVYGTPKISFKINPSYGSSVRYAELSEEFSNVQQGHFEYHYTIQGTDNGTISLDSLSFDIVSDAENKISYSVACWSNGVLLSVSQRVFNKAYLEYPGDILTPVFYPDVTNVKINTDSGSVTENQTRILLKRSSVASKVPMVSDLLLGELAANTTDGIIFLRRADDSIAKIRPLEPQDFDTFGVSISGNTNNLDLGLKSLVRFSVASAGFQVSGFVAGRDGEIKMIYNSGTQAVKILNNSSNSSSGNRVAVYNGADFDLLAGHGVTIVYDGTSSVWRLF